MNPPWKSQIFVCFFLVKVLVRDFPMLRSTMKRCLEMSLEDNKDFHVFIWWWAMREGRRCRMNEKQSGKRLVRDSLLLRSRLWRRGNSPKNSITIQRIVNLSACAISHFHLHTSANSSWTGFSTLVPCPTGRHFPGSLQDEELRFGILGSLVTLVVLRSSVADVFTRFAGFHLGQRV